MAGPGNAPPVVVWLRDDLRVTDNPALVQAVASGSPVIVAYTYDDTGTASRPLGAASQWWLHHSLAALAASLQKRGAALTLRRGQAAEEVFALLRDTGATDLYLNRRYIEGERDQDEQVAAEAEELEVETHDFPASLLHEPGEVLNGDGEPFGVFTPYWRAARSRGEPREPLPAPDAIRGWTGRTASVSLTSLGLLPTSPDWAGGLRETWRPGEKGAHRRLDEFATDGLLRYAEQRDFPGAEASSRLSPHLKFGELSPFQVWRRVRGSDVTRDTADKYLSEIGWREFNYQLLARHPRLDTENVHRQFDAFPWAEVDRDKLAAWQQGRTGVPLVDAGMRQLWHTGWMHNRVRMVTASFLVKNLHYDWRLGEQWFWDCLVDADPANNTAQWQWVAGSGVDAAPFFRVFNPVVQAQKFDPEGEYIRQWIPELRDVDGSALRQVGAVPAPVGPAYPDPIVDLKRTRQEALDAYEVMRG